MKYSPDIEKKLVLENLEPAILKRRMLEILEIDHWNKTALMALAELEFGDSSRLYRIDALKSDNTDFKLAKEFIMWEVEEEIMGSKEIYAERLSSRVARIFEVIDEGCENSLTKFCEILISSVIYI